MPRQKPRKTAGTISGYAATFDSPSKDIGFTEYIRAGAFKDSLFQLANVVALVNHDSGQLLGRSQSGTLRLKEDHKGLHFECDVSDTTAGRDALANIARHDQSECSFAFTIAEDGERWFKGENGEVCRELTRVDLHDISIVTSPAYSATSVQIGV